MILIKAKMRRVDDFGSGKFGASRGGRTHNGVDYKASPGDDILCPIEGRVTKIGYPYADDLSYRYVQITTAAGAAHRFFYVEPTVKLGMDVRLGDQLGTAQDIASRYDTNIKKMDNHVHYEIMINGEYVDPGEFYESS